MRWKKLKTEKLEIRRPKEDSRNFRKASKWFQALNVNGLKSPKTYRCRRRSRFRTQRPMIISRIERESSLESLQLNTFIVYGRKAPTFRTSEKVMLSVWWLPNWASSNWDWSIRIDQHFLMSVRVDLEESSEFQESREDASLKRSSWWQVDWLVDLVA